MVASWDGAPRLHQPLPLPGVELDGEVVAAGPFDFDLRDLTAMLEQPARRAGLPLSAPPRPTREWEQRLRSGRPLPDQAPPTVRHYRRHPNTGEVVRRQVLAEATILITAITHRLRTGRGRDVDGLANATGELLAALARTRGPRSRTLAPPAGFLAGPSRLHGTGRRRALEWTVMCRAATGPMVRQQCVRRRGDKDSSLKAERTIRHRCSSSPDVIEILPGELDDARDVLAGLYHATRG